MNQYIRLPRLIGGSAGNVMSSSHCKWAGIGEYLALFVALAGVVLFSVRPWHSFFFTGLGEHWDTQLMGQWMAWNAHNILNGNILCPDFNANYFYPHSLTLAFGEMLWPESFIYAALYGPTHNPFFAFNGTMLFFWALAGVTMYAFLRELGIGRAVGYLGGFIYCLMPLLLMYYIEFNMTLVFIIPLMLLLLMRWLRKPTLGHAFLFCLGCFISATSCIYYTYMVVFPLICMFAAYLVNHPALLRDKRFYWSLGLIGATVALTAVFFLYPYVLLTTQGGYARNMNDFMISHAQPLTYLDTRSSALFTHLFTPERRWAETYLFPGSVLAVLSLIYFVTQPAFDMGRPSERRWLPTGIAMAKTALWLTFWFIILTSLDSRGLPRLTGIASWLSPVSLALLTLYIFKLFLPCDGSQQTVFVSGLAAGAVICFFISLGPFITIGLDARLIKLAHGPLYLLFDQTAVFSVVRALTRFAAIVMVYLIVSSCVMLQRLVTLEKRVLWFFPLLLFFLFFEAAQMKYRYADYTNLVRSPVIQRARHLPEHSVLFQIPTTPKVVNAHSVLNTIGDFHFLVNGCSGFIPEFFSEINGLLRDWKVAEVTRRLTEIWPSVVLLVDRPSTKWLATGWKKPFPWKVLDSSWELMDRDADYSLYKLRQRVFTSNRLVRRARTDVLQENSILIFSARLSGEAAGSHTASFRVSLNGHEAARGVVGHSWQEYRITLPEEQMGNLSGDRVVLELAAAKQSAMKGRQQVRWNVRDVTFAAPIVH